MQQQAWIAGLPARYPRDQDHFGNLTTIDAGSNRQRGCPSAALVCPRMHIKIDASDQLAVFKDFIRLDRGVPDRKRRRAPELEAEQAARDIEHAVFDAVVGKVRPHRLRVKGVVGASHQFGVVAAFPGVER